VTALERLVAACSKRRPGRAEEAVAPGSRALRHAAHRRPRRRPARLARRPRGRAEGLPRRRVGRVPRLRAQRLDVDLDRDGPIVAPSASCRPQRAAGRRSGSATPTPCPRQLRRVHLVLEKVKPPLMLFSDKSAYPTHNDEQEQALRTALAEVARAARGQGPRPGARAGGRARPASGWVWAKLGKARLAGVLQHLVALADATEAPVGGSTRDALAGWYAADGYKADAAALARWRSPTTRTAPRSRAAVRALYLPWLQRAADRLADVVKAEGYPAPDAVPVEDGTCLLFADGLRWDVGAALADRLVAAGRRVEQRRPLGGVPPRHRHLQARRVADPRPARRRARGWHLQPEREGHRQDAGQRDLRQAHGRGRRAGARGQRHGRPIGRAWTEFGDIDKYGHKHGCKTARHVEDQLRELEQRVAELLDAGWKQVRVTTDHGWLLVPGGLPSTSCPAWLTDARWQRCALAKATSQVDLPDAPLGLGPPRRRAYPAGRGRLLHPDRQLPRVRPRRAHLAGVLHAGPHRDPRPARRGRQAGRPEVGRPALQGDGADHRQRPAPRPARQGRRRLQQPAGRPQGGRRGRHRVGLVPDDGKEGTAAFAVLLAPDGSVLDKRPTTIGGDA
jgi:hypothetical protein